MFLFSANMASQKERSSPILMLLYASLLFFTSCPGVQAQTGETATHTLDETFPEKKDDNNFRLLYCIGIQRHFTIIKFSR